MERLEMIGDGTDHLVTSRILCEMVMISIGKNGKSSLNPIQIETETFPSDV